jgi:glycosyltransferase involved in cell wall biosynthesis
LQPIRTAVLFHRFGPYHHARLRAAAARGEVVGIELSRVDRTYQWAPIAGAEGFRKITLFDDRDIAEISPRVISERMNDALGEASPSVIAIPGWGDASSLIALRWAITRGVPALAMSETTEVDMDRNAIREAVKSRIIRLFSGALVGGRSHKEYLRKLGIRDDRIALGYDCVDNDHFRAGATRAREGAGVARLTHQLPDDYFLASSRFVERKNLPGLIRAYARYRRMVDRPWHLVLLGDGPLRPELEEVARLEGVREHLVTPGFVQYENLPTYYGLARAFIHASAVEPWGLVVNEAMACALPVLVSRQSGCAHELVQEGRNGFTFDANDLDGIAALMARMSTACDLQALGAAGEALVSQWSCSRFAEGLWSLVAAVSGDTPRKRASRLDLGLLGMAIVR